MENNKVASSPSGAASIRLAGAVLKDKNLAGFLKGLLGSQTSALVVRGGARGENALIHLAGREFLVHVHGRQLISGEKLQLKVEQEKGAFLLRIVKESSHTPLAILKGMDAPVPREIIDHFLLQFSQSRELESVADRFRDWFNARPDEGASQERDSRSDRKDSSRPDVHRTGGVYHASFRIPTEHMGEIGALFLARNESFEDTHVYLYSPTDEIRSLLQRSLQKWAPVLEGLAGVEIRYTGLLEPENLRTVTTGQWVG